jgi:transposase
MFAGIDVSKARLDVHVRPSGDAWSVENTAEGHRQLVERLAPLKLKVAVLEASGGYESQASAALILGGIPTVIANPRQVRDFAKALGQLAKTDAIDASVIAHFAEVVPLELATVDDEATVELRALVDRRAQLVEMRTMELNRKAAAPSALRRHFDEHLRWLNAQIKNTEKDIGKRIKESRAWLETATLLQSAAGVGPATTAKLIVDLPELGRVSHKRIAALVGLAPYADQSGKRDGPRYCRGGRGDVRTVLYMATLSAIRSNEAIRTFYKRLVSSGKAPKLAIIACMRKLLTHLNAMLRTHTPWRPV